MNSIFEEIKEIRQERPIVIDQNNDNRYRILLNEDDGCHTAYYFSTPIYNEKTGKSVDIKFHKDSGAIYSIGSNCYITYLRKIVMESANGVCYIDMDDIPQMISDKELSVGDNFIYPTINGFVYKMNSNTNKEVSFYLEASNPHLNIQSNDKYFSLMLEKYKPLITISCIGTFDENKKIVSPAKLNYKKINDKVYKITFSHNSSIGSSIIAEINIYEPKLLQDTTVESANIVTNNAFGGVAFIGYTPEYGEQWLYSRHDYIKFRDLQDYQIIKATAYFPLYNFSNSSIDVYKVASRFCSFGSNWKNKISSFGDFIESNIFNKYQVADLTEYFADNSGRLMSTEGFILKPHTKGSSVSVIATGDSYYAPQIYEITYR